MKLIKWSRGDEDNRGFLTIWRITFYGLILQWISAPRYYNIDIISINVEVNEIDGDTDSYLNVINTYPYVSVTLALLGFEVMIDYDGLPETKEPDKDRFATATITANDGYEYVTCYCKAKYSTKQFNQCPSCGGDNYV